MTEAQLHRAVAAFLTAALPEACVWTTFPAGGGGKTRGALLKAAGLRKGWPDIQILWHAEHLERYRLRFIGIELKTAKGRLSDEQIVCHNDIHRMGGSVLTCRSVDDVETLLRAKGIPLRATLNPGGGWRKAA